MSLFILGLAALPVCVVAATYVYLGLGFWRLHRDDFTRLSVYILTHQSGLIANFAGSRPALLSRMNSLALDALSFPRVAKVVLLWPLFLSRFREVLEFARFTSRILGDERTDALAERLRQMGLHQADEDDVKSGDRFREGFLVRRLDDDLVAVFWHEASPDAGASRSGDRPPSLPRNVLPLRVPAERRVRSIAQLFQRWGFYTHVAEGLARSRGGKPLPYVVVYEPHSMGRAPSLRAFRALARADAELLLRKFLGDSFAKDADAASDSEKEFCVDTFGLPGFDVRGEAQEESEVARKAERAYRRFLLSTQTLSRHET
ncbi:MAG: hypothetical protein IOD12_00550 [Silvanigrellales bacterium]|nr:hypothetical protein [Silvanigrellales bacterium]